MIQKNLTILLLALGLGGMELHAQQHSFYQAADTFDRAQLKYVMEAVADAFPDAEVFPSDDMRVLQVKTTTPVNDAELRSAIASAGVQLLPGTPDLKALYGEAPDVPMYVDTGDPPADHARYVQAVNDWNEAHPDQPLPQPLPYVDEQ